MKRSLISAVLISLLMLSPVVAVQSSSVAVNESDLHFGDSFTVTADTNANNPWVLARCYPNVSSVYSAIYADGSIWGWWRQPAETFVLGESIYPLWTGGGADCTVELYQVRYNAQHGFTQTLLATADFEVVIT